MTDQHHDTPEPLDPRLREAMAAYHRPPDADAVPLDAIWRDVAADAFGAPHLVGPDGRPAASRRWRRVLVRPGVFAAAATLVLGIAIGRVTATSSRDAHGLGTDAAPARTAAERQLPASSGETLDPAMSRYLGQAAALLIAFPAETSHGTRDADERFITRANDLLVTTRLLLDSPDSADRSLRDLLDDLELVLVQIVRLRDERERGERTEIELIQQALDQHDVLPRLRTVVSARGAAD